MATLDNLDDLTEVQLRRRLVEAHERLETQNNETLELLRHPRSNGFWHINLGHVITFIITFVTVLGAFYKLDNRVTLQENAFAMFVKVTNDAETAMAKRLESIDEKGTVGSQRGIYQDTEISKSNERRITQVELTLREIVPNLSTINANINWMMNFMSGVKPQRPTVQTPSSE